MCDEWADIHQNLCVTNPCRAKCSILYMCWSLPVDSYSHASGRCCQRSERCHQSRQPDSCFLSISQYWLWYSVEKIIKQLKLFFPGTSLESECWRLRKAGKWDTEDHKSLKNEEKELRRKWKRQRQASFTAWSPHSCNATIPLNGWE